jgi:hypothetical protein
MKIVTPVGVSSKVSWNRFRMEEIVPTRMDMSCCKPRMVCSRLSRCGWLLNICWIRIFALLWKRKRMSFSPTVNLGQASISGISLHSIVSMPSKITMSLRSQYNTYDIPKRNATFNSTRKDLHEDCSLGSLTSKWASFGSDDRFGDGAWSKWLVFSGGRKDDV